MLRWQAGRVRWEPIRLLIADSDPLFLSGLRALLAQMGDMDITGEATSGPEAVLLAEEAIPDILLLDVKLAESVTGTEVMRQVLGQNPHIGIVLLMETEDPELVFRGMRAGARGYAVKGASPQTLRRRIKAAFRGEVILSPVVTKTLLDRLRGASRHAREGPNGALITKRERQVLQLGANGLSNKEVAGELAG
jgi:DNA-binding NarL/FixJ family response regulator